jgi:hypothetical protein
MVGIVNPDETVRYVVSAAQGQVLSANLIIVASEVRLGVSDPTGAWLKAVDTTHTWSTAIPASGEYTIHIVGPAGIQSPAYTLQVRLMPAP